MIGLWNLLERGRRNEPIFVADGAVGQVTRLLMAVVERRRRRRLREDVFQRVRRPGLQSVATAAGELEFRARELLTETSINRNLDFRLDNENFCVELTEDLFANTGWILEHVGILIFGS